MPICLICHGHLQPSLFPTATLSNHLPLLECLHIRFSEAQTKEFFTIGKNLSHFYGIYLKDSFRTACKHAASKLRKQSYKGYAMKQEAHQAYNMFISNGSLPPGIPAPDPRDSLPGTPTPASSPVSSLQRGTPALSPRGTPPPSPQRGIRSPRRFNTASPLSRRFNTGRQPLNITISSNTTVRSPPVSQIIPPGQLASSSVDESDPFQDDYRYWVVFTGASPGVYEGR